MHARFLLSVFVFTASASALNAQGFLAPAAGAALGAILTQGKSNGVQAGAAAGGALVGYFADSMLKDKAAREKFKAYQLGRYQEAWIRAESDWYYSTLDRKTGLPPAFDGNWAMFIGLPVLEREQMQKRAALPPAAVPAEREAYLAYLQAATAADTMQSAVEAAPALIAVPTTKAVVPARTVNGIQYRPSLQEFPRLP